MSSRIYFFLAIICKQADDDCYDKKVADVTIKETVTIKG